MVDGPSPVGFKERENEGGLERERERERLGEKKTVPWRGRTARRWATSVYASNDRVRPQEKRIRGEKEMREREKTNLPHVKP